MGFGLIIGFTAHFYTKLVTTTILPLLIHNLQISLLCLQQFSGNGFQWLMFHLHLGSQIALCLSYQFVKNSS
jgi:uncharacterized membrane protein (Fun14 family)